MAMDKNRFILQKRLLEMECRKDILTENQHLNQKILKRRSTYRSRLHAVLLKNKFRIAYLLGFCGVYSLDWLYNYIFFQNPFYSMVTLKLSKLATLQPPTIKQQNQLTQDYTKETHTTFAQLFLDLDRGNQQITPKMMNSLVEGRSYHHDYVDMNSFVEFLSPENAQNVGFILKNVHQL